LGSAVSPWLESAGRNATEKNFGLNRIAGLPRQAEARKMLGSRDDESRSELASAGKPSGEFQPGSRSGGWRAVSLENRVIFDK